MSYDIDLMMDTGGPEPVSIEWWNYTYNCGPMFRLAIPTGGGLQDLDGKPASAVAGLLTEALAFWDEHSPEMRALDPPNGWGDHASARDLLVRIRDACRDHPKTVVRVS